MLTIRRVSLVAVAATVAVACAGSSDKGQGADNNGGGGTDTNSTSGNSGSSPNGSNPNSGTTTSNTTNSTSGNSGSNQTSTSTSTSASSSGTSGSSSSSSGGTIADETLPGPTYITTSATSQFVTGTMTTVTSGTVTLTVNDGTKYQTFNGFGGAFNEKGWSVIQTLSAADQATAMNLLFDWTKGAHFVYGRIPMGASDYALSRYTEDDNNGQADYTMANFSIAEDRKYLIPYVQAALAINPNIQLWSSPWTPPAWMKVNGMGSNFNGDTSPYDGGQMNNTQQVLTAWALYETKFVQQYAAEGINISWIVPQNEPNYAPNYPSCLWDPTTFDTYVQTYLAPELAAQNMSTQIYLGTMSCYSATPGPITSGSTPCTTGDEWSDTDVVKKVTGDSATMKFIKGFAMQWNERSDVTNVTKFALPIDQTEHEAGNDPFTETTILPYNGAVQTLTQNTTMAPNDFSYAVESYGLIGEWLQAGANSYSAWNMVLDNVGLGLDMHRIWPQNALLTVTPPASGSSTGTLNITPAYYVFRHFSQFIAPGASRVQVTGSSSLVANAYAFLNPDNSHAVIMYNDTGSAVQTIISVGGAMVEVTVPAYGFATLKT